MNQRNKIWSKNNTGRKFEYFVCLPLPVFLFFCFFNCMINLMIVLIGFFSKQFVLYSAIQNGYYFISIIAIIVSVISASYYLKIIKVLHTDPSGNNQQATQRYLGPGAGKNSEQMMNLGLEPSNSTLTNTHSFLISSLTLIILLFFIKPSIILNSTQLLSLSLFYI